MRCITRYICIYITGCPAGSFALCCIPLLDTQSFVRLLPHLMIVHFRAFAWWYTSQICAFTGLSLCNTVIPFFILDYLGCIITLF